MPHLLLNNGYVTLVDETWLPMLSAVHWRAKTFPGGEVYVASQTSRGGRQSTELIHRLILDAPSGVMVDHIDGNPMNNTSANLRLCTNRQNIHYARGKKSSTSWYKGVSWHVGSGRWRSQVVKDGSHHFLGALTSEHEAALAYNRKAAELFGEFARLNILPDGTTGLSQSPNSPA